MWCPLVSIAPAIRDGLVRVSGIDPKGMELAYGRRIFHRYAVTGTDAVALLDDLVAAMDARKSEFAGRVRSVPISCEHPLELLEFDEIGALTKYTDRKTRDTITEKVALLTTQGRALGFTVRGYVQEPTKDTVPVRELFPRRICLRVSAKSHVSMVLGDQAYERGAWANRITETEAGVGYVFGEGIREPPTHPRRLGPRRNDQATRNIRHRPHHPPHRGAALPHQIHRSQRVNSRRRSMNSTVDLLNAVCVHLTAFELPAIASVHVSAAPSAPRVTVQLASHEPAAIAQGLLAWADTLTEVTAGARRTSPG